MILPTMTEAEMRKELCLDAPIVFRKAHYIIEDVKKKISKQAKINGFEKFYDYSSKYKNQWIVRILVNKKVEYYTVMLVFHNGKGHAGIETTPEMHIIYHTVHFFQRYNERLNLGFTNYKDIMCAYMSTNPRLNFEILDETGSGVNKIFAFTQTGVILGTFYRDHDLVKTNTFIANHMLTKNQAELKMQLKYALDKYGDESKWYD